MVFVLDVEKGKSIVRVYDEESGWEMGQIIGPDSLEILARLRKLASTNDD